MASEKNIQSKTADMIFDEDLTFWWNELEYLSDEYEGGIALERE